MRVAIVGAGLAGLATAVDLVDKLSVIAKNSSPNASPVQLSVVSC